MKEVTFKGADSYNRITMKFKNNIPFGSRAGIFFRALLMPCLFLFYFNSQAQNTYPLPDTNFRNFLFNNHRSVLDTTGKLLVIANAKTQQGTLNCSNLNIKDLSGIEHFINIATINCSHNEISYIPSLAAYNNFLIEFDCSYNRLSNLPTFSNGAFNLKSIKCSNNLLHTLGAYAYITNLDTLACQNNYLTIDDLLRNNPSNIFNYSYAPQYPVEIAPRVVVEEDEPFNFEYPEDDTIYSSSHKVFRNGIQIANPIATDSFFILHVKPSDAGFYTWEVTDSLLPALKLRTTAQELVVANKNTAIFTPDGDNNNDSYLISCDGIKSIYNKHGKLMKQFQGAIGYWDGTDLQGNPAPTGVYMIRCGEKMESSVTLVR
jgi:hypothetical protein